MRQRQARPCSIRRAVSALVAIGVGLWCFMHYQFALTQQAHRAARAPEPVIAPEPVAHHSSGLFAKLNEKKTVVTPTKPPAPKPIKRNDTRAHGIVALTYASHPGRDDRFCRSLESAIRNGLDLRVLGWGVKWEGLSQKLGAALRAVEELPGDCPVVFTDAYDVLFTQGESAMRKAFDDIKADLVFSAECGCWPQVQRDRGRTCRDAYPPSPTPYRYLNSGSWAGKASVAAKFLRAIGAGSTSQEFHKLNDQELASELYLQRGFPGLQLDHHAKLFQAMHSINDDTLVPNCDPRPHLREIDGVWRNTLTGSTPAVFHFNGGGKRHHLPMEARTWWKRCRTAQMPDALDKVAATKLLFNGVRRSFGDVCPGHLSKARGAADHDCDLST